MTVTRAREDAPQGTLVTEASSGLTESVDGRYLIRIIDAGEGSSAVYPPAVVEQAATDRIFPAGTRIHLDHPRESDEHDLPARSVKDWCAVITEDAVWNPTAQALEAPIKVFRPYQVLVEDLKDHVGLSIHAWIESAPAPGKPVATRFLPSPHNTVDFVTAAGRGGRILAALESARAGEATSRDRREQLSTAVKAAYQTGPDSYVWVRDFDETRTLVWFEDREDRCWEQPYQTAADDLSVVLTGTPVEVRPVLQYVPLSPVGDSTTEGDESMDTLKELEAQVAELTQKMEALTAQATALTAENVELKTAKQNSENADKARIALPTVEGFDKLPAAAQVRVTEALTLNVPTTEAGDFNESQFATLAAAAVKAEADYLASVAPRNDRLTGFGDTKPATEGFTPYTDAWGRKINKGA